MGIRRFRNVPVMFYLTDAEKKELIAKAQESDLSLSDYCRKTLLGKRNEDYGFGEYSERIEKAEAMGLLERR